MIRRFILYIFFCAGFLCSCGLYRPYERPADLPVSGLYRDTLSVRDTLVADTLPIGNLPWQEIFTDPLLQRLIRQGLERNTDLLTAFWQIEEAEALLRSSRLAYLPSLTLSPEGTISSYDTKKAVQTYQLPVTASWEVDLFGRLRNASRSAQAALIQSEAYQQAVRTQLIASIANSYYTLLMLDRQLQITEQTLVFWRQNIETNRIMKKAGMVNEAAVVQSEANAYTVEATLPDLLQNIRETENALSLLLALPPQEIPRGTIEQQQFPERLSTGLPIQLLANRPDVRSAEMALAQAFYTTNQARAAFYPQLTLSGSAGWTNSAGTTVVNPAKFIASAVGSLTQPIFSQGTLRANLRVARARQEEARLAFEQTLLEAGSKVSNALYQYHATNEKVVFRYQQIDALEKSVEYTQMLLRLGSSTYLEVLTAQQSLLNAQLSQVTDWFDRMQAVVNLYQALGGGREETYLNTAYYD
ncbi:MAG: efflux transporter outer membrane subunit [Bacteroides sp.]|nr:efflux transporter outer membrane subunit [Bacteroides sp.]